MLLHSDVARLVLGYLAEENCPQTYQSFLNESVYLRSMRHIFPKDGSSMTIFGKSLSRILNEYHAMKDAEAIYWNYKNKSYGRKQKFLLMWRKLEEAMSAVKSFQITSVLDNITSKKSQCESCDALSQSTLVVTPSAPSDLMFQDRPAVCQQLMSSPRLPEFLPENMTSPSMPSQVNNQISNPPMQRESNRRKKTQGVPKRLSDTQRRDIETELKAETSSLLLPNSEAMAVVGATILTQMKKCTQSQDLSQVCTSSAAIDADATKHHQESIAQLSLESLLQADTSLNEMEFGRELEELLGLHMNQEKDEAITTQPAAEEVQIDHSLPPEQPVVEESPKVFILGDPILLKVSENTKAGPSVIEHQHEKKKPGRAVDQTSDTERVSAVNSTKISADKTSHSSPDEINPLREKLQAKKTNAGNVEGTCHEADVLPYTAADSRSMTDAELGNVGENSSTTKTSYCDKQLDASAERLPSNLVVSTTNAELSCQNLPCCSSVADITAEKVAENESLSDADDKSSKSVFSTQTSADNVTLRSTPRKSSAFPTTVFGESPAKNTRSKTKRLSKAMSSRKKSTPRIRMVPQTKVKKKKKIAKAKASQKNKKTSSNLSQTSEVLVGSLKNHGENVDLYNGTQEITEPQSPKSCVLSDHDVSPSSDSPKNILTAVSLSCSPRKLTLRYGLRSTNLRTALQDGPCAAFPESLNFSPTSTGGDCQRSLLSPPKGLSSPLREVKDDLFKDMLLTVGSSVVQVDDDSNVPCQDVTEMSSACTAVYSRNLPVAKLQTSKPVSEEDDNRNSPASVQTKKSEPHNNAAVSEGLNVQDIVQQAVEQVLNARNTTTQANSISTTAVPMQSHLEPTTALSTDPCPVSETSVTASVVHHQGDTTVPTKHPSQYVFSQNDVPFSSTKASQLRHAVVTVTPSLAVSCPVVALNRNEMLHFSTSTTSTDVSSAVQVSHAAVVADGPSTVAANVTLPTGQPNEIEQSKSLSMDGEIFETLCKNQVTGESLTALLNETSLTQMLDAAKDMKVAEFEFETPEKPIAFGSSRFRTISPSTGVFTVFENDRKETDPAPASTQPENESPIVTSSSEITSRNTEDLRQWLNSSCEHSSEIKRAIPNYVCRTLDFSKPPISVQAKKPRYRKLLPKQIIAESVISTQAIPLFQQRPTILKHSVRPGFSGAVKKMLFVHDTQPLKSSDYLSLASSHRIPIISSQIAGKVIEKKRSETLPKKPSASHTTPVPRLPSSSHVVVAAQLAVSTSSKQATIRSQKKPRKPTTPMKYTKTLSVTTGSDTLPEFSTTIQPQAPVSIHQASAHERCMLEEASIAAGITFSTVIQDHAATTMKQQKAKSSAMKIKGITHANASLSSIDVSPSVKPSSVDVKNDVKILDSKLAQFGTSPSAKVFEPPSCAVEALSESEHCSIGSSVDKSQLGGKTSIACPGSTAPSLTSETSAHAKARRDSSEELSLRILTSDNDENVSQVLVSGRRKRKSKRKDAPSLEKRFRQMSENELDEFLSKIHDCQKTATRKHKKHKKKHKKKKKRSEKDSMADKTHENKLNDRSEVMSQTATLASAKRFSPKSQCDVAETFCSADAGAPTDQPATMTTSVRTTTEETKTSEKITLRKIIPGKNKTPPRRRVRLISVPIPPSKLGGSPLHLRTPSPVVVCRDSPNTVALVAESLMELSRSHSASYINDSKKQNNGASPTLSFASHPSREQPESNSKQPSPCKMHKHGPKKKPKGSKSEYTESPKSLDFSKLNDLNISDFLSTISYE